MNKQDLLQSEKSVVCLEFMLLIGLGISQYMAIEVVNLALTLVIIALMCIMRLETMVIMLFVAMPFFNMFSVQIGTTSLYYVMVFILWVKYCLHKRGIPKNKFICFALLLLLRLPNGNFANIATWAVLFSIVFITYKEAYFTDRAFSIIEYTTVSSLIGSMIGYIMLIGKRSIYTRSYVYNNGVSTTRFAGLIGDSVFFAQFAAILIAVNLVVALYRPQYRKKAYVYCGILSFFDLLTYSKTGLLLIVVTVVCYVIMFMIQNAKNRRTLFKTAGILLLSPVTIFATIIYISNHMDDPMISNYLTRFMSLDLWTGRNEVAEHYLGLINSNWTTFFFAMPQSVYDQGIYVGVNFIRYAHNIYIETACAFGVIAAILIFFWFARKIIQCLLQRYDRLYCLMPMAVLLASGLSLHGHSEWHYYFMVVFSLLMIDDNVYSVLVQRRRS